MKTNPNDKIGLYLMNQKGLTVLQTLIEKELTPFIAFVCVGRDQAVQNDYASDIFALSQKHNILTLERDSPTPVHALALAIGWRWLILESVPLLVIHDSLLPKYRGFAPLVNMLINGESEIGASLIWASEEYDSGNIIAQSRLKIHYPITIDTAISKIESAYKDLASDLADHFKIGQIPEGIPQDETKASYSLWRDEQDYYIDWSLSAEKILRTIHACGFPYLYCKTRIEGEIITIKNAELIDDVTIENRTPGKVIFMKNKQPVVVCGTGLLQITEMEKSGKAFSLKSFRVRFS